jgi:hypothetical protein
MVNIPSVTLKKCYFDFGSIIETTHIVVKKWMELLHNKNVAPENPEATLFIVYRSKNLLFNPGHSC